MKRRGRKFWEPLVAEVESGSASKSEVAQKHRVALKTLQWWHYRLRSERAKAAGPLDSSKVRLIPVELTPGRAAAAAMELRLGHDVGLHFETGTDVGYIAALVAALRARR